MAPFRCQKCGKSFLTLEKFTIHNYSHTRERPFKCSKTECGKAFVSKYKLMRDPSTFRIGCSLVALLLSSLCSLSFW
ncbi:pleiomorphic adenoma gene-like 1 [Rattus norvegicus]|uniref:Pleiomorphic adenoma gene-like 1 n=1 Tax=Rattus norvegicus TaxID=10116 RepID=A6JP53_RAT|nr:pleiomorphic adenoma gene-like 1 [Rattus norvegicus]